MNVHVQPPVSTESVAADQLKAFVERVEKLQEEIDGLNGDKSDVFKEAKAVGFDVKAMKKVIALRRMDPAERQHQEAVIDLYSAALGLV